MPDLSAAMRKALEAATRPEGLRRVHKPGPGRPPWPAHPHTIAALVRHGLVEHRRIRHRHGWPVDQWVATEAGKAALTAPPRVLTDQPRFLAPGGGYTSVPARSVDVEHDQWGRRAVETVDAPASWVRAGRVRHADAQDRRELARRIARTGRRAA